MQIVLKSFIDVSSLLHFVRDCASICYSFSCNFLEKQNQILFAVSERGRRDLQYLVGSGNECPSMPVALQIGLVDGRQPCTPTYQIGQSTVYLKEPNIRAYRTWKVVEGG